MDSLIRKYPDGIFDMIFADPPYFLSNGGITCQSGKMVKVDKGQWDKSKGPEMNHEFNKEWLSRCQKVLKPNGTIWIGKSFFCPSERSQPLSVTICIIILLLLPPELLTENNS